MRNTASSGPKRLWNTPNLEEYILSVCLQHRQALAHVMRKLKGNRDFKDIKNRMAFGVLEQKYSQGIDIDPIVIIDTWTDLDIFSQTEARRIANVFEGNIDFEPKVEELRKVGSIRQIKKDIEKLNEEANKDTTPEKLASQAVEMAIQWNTGSSRKFYTATELEQMEKEQNTGEHLRQGIPILDDKIYLNAGQQKGTAKCTVFREKHGKTRHACWEAAQDLRQGRKVLYITLEGQASEIKKNIQQVLQDDWDKIKEGLLIKDGSVEVDEIQSSIVEAIFTEKIDKVIIDYLQLMEQPNIRSISENVNSNRCCQQITRLAVKYNLNLHFLSQARQSDKTNRGYNNTPKVYDVYGSNQLIKDSSLIMVGIRPRNYEELIEVDGKGKKSVKHPTIKNSTVPLNSVFVKPILSRKKLKCQHMWIHFIDTDEGFKIFNQNLI